jgi:hypothetical protein
MKMEMGAKLLAALLVASAATPMVLPLTLRMLPWTQNLPD